MGWIMWIGGSILSAVGVYMGGDLGTALSVVGGLMAGVGMVLAFPQGGIGGFVKSLHTALTQLKTLGTWVFHFISGSVLFMLRTLLEHSKSCSVQAQLHRWIQWITMNFGDPWADASGHDEFMNTRDRLAAAAVRNSARLARGPEESGWRAELANGTKRGCHDTVSVAERAKAA